MKKLRKALDWLLLKPMAHLCFPVVLAINRAGRRNGRAFRFTDIVSAFDNDVQPLPAPENTERSHQRTRAGDVKRIRKTLDSALLSLVARRLARFRRLHDAGDEFADAVVKLMAAEMERRNRLYAGWAAELAAKEAAAADRTRRELAMEQFKVLRCENRPQLVQ